MVMRIDFDDGMRWDGGYKVPVRIERRSQVPVKNISAVALWRREWELANGDWSCIDTGCTYSGWKPLMSAEGKSEVYVLTGGQNSVFGRPVRYVRQEVVVLKVVYDNGTVTYVTAAHHLRSATGWCAFTFFSMSLIDASDVSPCQGQSDPAKGGV
jgi:hypothetical protein